ncbi:hypothetical protein DPP16_03390 [Salmonella enterica subsp. salamae serovar Sofia]|nr:hypothetical protein [Salmonella enterica subsp. salamae serovar Sofia]
MNTGLHLDYVKSYRKLGIIPAYFLSQKFHHWGTVMSDNKKTNGSYAKPSRADIVRSVVTSTAVETGQSSAKIEASLEATRKKFAHLRLAV